jgi:hypothetical protein
LGLKKSPGEEGPMSFPPLVVVEVKALACEIPFTSGLPLSRFSIGELRREAIERGIVANIGNSTIWRWLSEDAIKPWRSRSWIFPRDPDFTEKAGRVLDLYEGMWEGKPLGKRDYVISADEKTSIQARIRKHPTAPPSSGKPMKVEHEYARGGSLAYLAALDVHRCRVFGRCEQRSGIEPFDRLVSQVMEAQPYRSARRVFWIIDNGSSHRGDKSIKRLQEKWNNIVPVHLPVHASWLNQIEIYFSIVQRKVLTPNDFASLEEVEKRLLGFQQRYEEIAQPFEWRFTRKDLEGLMRKIEERDESLPKVA